MSIGKFLRALFGGKEQPDATTQKYLEYQKQNLEGNLTFSAQLVCVVTLSAELKRYLADYVKPALERAGYQYDDNPRADAAANAALDNTSGTKPAFASEPGRIAPPAPSISRAPIQTSRKIRARFRDGVLVPSEPLGYAEDEELEITIERIARKLQ